MNRGVPRWVRATSGWLAVLLWPLAFVFVLVPAGEHCPSALVGALSHSCEPESGERVAWGVASLMLAVLMSFVYVVALLRRDDT